LVFGTFFFLAIYAPVSACLLSLTTLSSFYVFQSGISFSTSAVLVVLQNVLIFIGFKLGLFTGMLLPDGRILPLGLSYYSFRQIHYAIEKYKGKLSAHDFKDYVAYMFFIPTFLVGPINRFQPFLRDSYRRRWDSRMFSLGLERILFGYTKIVILGNFLTGYVFKNFVESLDHEMIWIYNYLSVLGFTWNTFFQFAGFSDVAIGLSLLFGFRVMENFNYPFFAHNIVDFWARWHISLSSWCKDYVFTPLSSITRNSLIGILCTMLVMGLWHDISFKYIIWSGYHAMGIGIWYVYSRHWISEFIEKRVPYYRTISIWITFHFVMLSFVIVKGSTWSEILSSYRIFFGLY